MTTYNQRVAKNILPLSRGNKLPEVFEEWYFTEVVKDHGEAIMDCYLCDQERLRYHFEIKNEHTDNDMWIGSSCILRFGIKVFDDDSGDVLDSKAAKRKLDKLTDNMRRKSCLNAIRLAIESERFEKVRKILNGAYYFYSEKGYLTPKYARSVLKGLSRNKIDHNPSFFKVSLKNGGYKEDLSEISEEDFRIIWGALTSSQREIAIKLGKAPVTK
jgi:hypothetical protein